MSTPPGWYPDPNQAGSQRWWDGAAWTDDAHQPGAEPGVPALAEKASSRLVPLALAGACLVVLAGLVWFFALRSDNDAASGRGLPTAMSVEPVLAAGAIDGSPIGLSREGRAVAFDDADDQTCRMFLEEPDRAVACVTPSRPVDPLIIGGGVWVDADSPLITNLANFLRSPEVVNFDDGTVVDLFAESQRVRRPLDIDGDRLLLVDDEELIVTTFEGERQEVVTVLSNSRTLSGRFANDHVLVATVDLDSVNNQSAIERHGSEGTDRVTTGSDHAVIVDRTNDARRVIALDLTARSFLRDDALLLIDFDDRSSRRLLPPISMSERSFGHWAWFSESGDVLYALFDDFDAGTATLVATPLAELRSSDIDWTELTVWDVSAPDTPDALAMLAPMARSEQRFLYIGQDGGVYALTPTFGEQ